MEYIQSRLKQWDFQRKQIKDPESTIYSSFLFLTNFIIGIYYNYYLYSLLFLFLFITSIVYRMFRCDLTYTIDKCAAFSVIIYGGYIFYLNLMNISLLRLSVILFSFLYTFFLFYYGYYKNEYCYNKDPTISQEYHSLLHLISSIGHHLIMTSVKLN